MNTTPKTPPGTQSAQRALKLLSLISDAHESGCELKELVAATGMDRTTVYRLTSALIASRFVERDPVSKKYRLGISAMTIGLRAMNRAPILESTRSALKLLAAMTEDCVFLTIRNGDYAQCLHMEQGTFPIKVVSMLVGNLRLMGIGTAGLALLTPFDSEDIEQLYQRHRDDYAKKDITVTDLKRTVREARTRGFTYGQSRLIADVNAVGVAFEVGDGHHAAISIAAIASRLPLSRAEQIAALIKDQLRESGFDV